MKTNASIIKVTLHFNDPGLEADEQDEEAQYLINQLQDLEREGEIEAVQRVPDPNPPAGNKAIGAFLAGILTAEVNVANFKKLMGFLSDRLSGKAIELKVEANGRKLEVTAYSEQELAAAIKAAQEFIAV